MALGPRMRPVTLAALVNRGALLFAWIHPGETLPGLDDAPESGAFAYVMKEGMSGFPNSDAIYFPVAH